MQQSDTAVNRRVLVIYEHAGGGHYSHAKAIKKAFHKRFPECDVQLMHISAASDSKMVARFYNFYNVMLKASPRLIHYAYRIVNAVNIEQLILPLLPRASRNLQQYFLAAKPDIIVSVFSGFNYPALHIRKKLGWSQQIPYVIFVTDLTKNFVRTWVQPDADLIIGMLPETEEQLLDYGMPAEKIRILSGMPVDLDFRSNRLSKEEARTRLGLAPDCFTVLITLGGVATKNTLDFARELAESSLPLQLMVVCGRNESLKQQVEQLARAAPILCKVFSFTDEMPTLMDASDAAISKPGPATIAELACKEIPILLDGTLPPMPQEKGNLDFVVKNKIGWVITRDRPAAQLVRELMDNPERAEQLRANMRRVQSDSATDELTDLIVNAQIDSSARQHRPHKRRLFGRKLPHHV